MGNETQKMVMMRVFYLVFVLLWPATSLVGQTLMYIETLDSKDFIFTQLIADIKENYQRIALGKELLPLSFFGYTPHSGESLYTIAARLNLTYDTIASLNNLSSPLLISERTTLLIPNCPGLFIREDHNDMFFYSLQKRLQSSSHLQTWLPSNATTINADFYPNERFNPSERKLFLLGFFQKPLRHQLIATSSFGKRYDPTGRTRKVEMHTGQDYKASMNSPVLAARGGIVSAVKTNAVYGIYVVIDHEKGYQTLYGHLNNSQVHIGDKVQTGQTIALSGNTGRSTGPHLHFEIRLNGKPINPAGFIKG
jgi:murein DD-endopeptidase MepM/ murein hydrolase activator NlpD